MNIVGRVALGGVARASGTAENEWMDGGATGLVGRVEERQAIGDVLASVRLGMSAILVLRGEAGIGKTALLDDAVGSASDFEVLRVVGIESEKNLRFAALHQLLRPLLEGLDALPEAQANALRAAFGLDNTVAADRFLVGLATLTLLATAATRHRLVLVVDDAQWLDEESESVVAFVARRLLADQIGVLIAVRVPCEHELRIDGLPSVDVGPLVRQASTELMQAVIGGPVDDAVRTRVTADARGNPLAILELTRELMQHAYAGDARLPQPLWLGRQLEARFLRQVHALPSPTQRLLLTAAAEASGDPALLWTAGVVLDFDEDAAKEAEAADLISFGQTVTFRHPLIREAIYHGAHDSERRRTHAVLADAINIDSDPDRHSWHRAAATLAPDEDVAAELEAAATRASHQGGYGSTAALLMRAAQLTPDNTMRGIRFLQSAAADLTAGQPARAQTTLALSKPLLHDGFVRAQGRRLEGGIDFALGKGGQSPAIMLEAANGLVAYDVREARETVLDALLMAVWFGKWSAAGVHDVARAAKTMPLPAGEQPTSTDLALDGLSEYYTSGPTIAAPRLRRALDAIANDQAVREVPRRMSFGLWAAYALGDHKAGFELGREYVALSREMGALNHLGEALHYVGLLELRAGSLTRANTCFAEEAELQQVRSIYNSGTVGEMLVCAWRGDANEVHARVERIRAVARERQLGWSAALAAVGLATLELALGNYRAATEGATDGWKDDIAVSALTASDAVEAHVRSGRPDAAAEYLAWLEELARATNMPYELGLLARSRALASEDADTELLYEEAIKRLAESGGALHLGRAQLLYREWLRRRKRRRDAREQLRLAHETFDEQGAAAFAERARVELLATGETARKRVDETRDDLTPQEAQIASLAAEGGTNLEIATQLFISASTVEYHLRKVYRKLGISSRRALAGAISAN